MLLSKGRELGALPYDHIYIYIYIYDYLLVGALPVVISRRIVETYGQTGRDIPAYSHRAPQLQRLPPHYLCV